MISLESIRETIINVILIRSMMGINISNWALSKQLQQCGFCLFTLLYMLFRLFITRPLSFRTTSKRLPYLVLLLKALWPVTFYGHMAKYPLFKISNSQSINSSFGDFYFYFYFLKNQVWWHKQDDGTVWNWIKKIYNIKSIK